MDRNKKKTVKRVLFALLTLAVALALVALPFVLDKQKSEGSKGSVLTATVSLGDIQKQLSGTGTITEQSAQTASVPSGVQVTQYLVANGDFVKEGDPVALVDQVSVMETISALRETMDAVAEDLERAKKESATSNLTAPAAARVKAVYCAAGDSVQAVMLEHGALAVLSLDGLMSVSFPSKENLAIGETVNVVLADGQTVTGRVESCYDGTATVTISDTYGAIDESVQVQDLEGKTLGSGSLQVHSAWKAVGTDGTVTRVSVSEGRNVYSGGAVLTITASEGGDAYAQLLAEYQAYEEDMAKLFRLYVDGAVTAPCDGMVSGVDDSLLKLSSEGGWTLRLLTNAPGDDPDKGYANRVGYISAVNEDGTVTAKMQGFDTEVPDYTDFSSLWLDQGSMTQETSFYPPTVFSWNGESWVAGGTMERGDVFLFAYDGSLVWAVKVGHFELPEEQPEPQPEPQPGPGEGGQGGEGGNQENPSGFPDMSGGMGGMSGMPSGGASFGSFSGASQETETARSATTYTTILSVTPQETVSISITVDELDILSVHLGQEVLVTLDALPGQSFAGRITEVNTTASNDGGNSKYSAMVELTRTGSMLEGMNASASITVESVEGVLVLPSAALVEQNGESAVYTAYNEQEGTLSGLVTVETGLSDGETVQILSGLKEGDAVWYRYYDKVEIKGLS